MTRAHVPGVGLPGAGQVCFPEPPREHARDLALYGEADIGVYGSVDDGGGSFEKGYNWGGASVDARIDPLGSGSGGSRAGQVREDSTHIVTFRDGQEVSTSDRVRIEDSEWLITALRERTDELVVRVEVKHV